MRLGGKRPQMTRELELPLENRGEAPTGKRSEKEPTAVRETSARERELRPVGCAPAGHATSTSRTARCGPACRVVWQGSPV